MSATFAMNTLTATPFGHKVDIPEAPIAKLMYYLNCVNVVVQIEDIITSKLIDYQNYFILSSAERDLVFESAKILDPSKFINAGIFIRTPNLVFSDNTGNQFYEITDETIGAHVSKEISIAGRSVKVLKLMACNDLWLDNYYFKPIITFYALKNGIKFGAVPINMTCPYCESKITTKIEETFQILACFCCIINVLIYCCIQICRNKNICCFNVTHRCPQCGRVLGNYDAC